MALPTTTALVCVLDSLSEVISSIATVDTEEKKTEAREEKVAGQEKETEVHAQKFTCGPESYARAWRSAT